MTIELRTKAEDRAELVRMCNNVFKPKADGTLSPHSTRDACMDVDTLLAEVARLEGELADFKDALKLMERKVITCGVAASHPDPKLTRTKKCYADTWNSPQAEAVRKVREERDEARAECERLRSSLRHTVSLLMGTGHTKIAPEGCDACEQAVKDAAMNSGGGGT